MQPIQVRNVSQAEHEALDALYQATKDVRIRTRAQMVLLAVETNAKAEQIAKIVRKDEETVRRWLKRFKAEGIEGLQDAPRSGAPAQVTSAFRARLLEVVRPRPRSLGLPFSLWTLQGLVDFMAEETGLRLSRETVRLLLKAAEIVLSRPQHKVSSPDPAYQLKKRRSKPSATTSSPAPSSTTPPSSI